MTSTRRPICARCNRPRDRAAEMVRDEICTSCLLEDLRKPNNEWSFFLRTLRACVREDGTLHVNDVRPHLRGKVEPKHVGLYWRRAATLKLIRFKEWEQSTDEAGGNSDKLARFYVWTAAEKRVAA